MEVNAKYQAYVKHLEEHNERSKPEYVGKIKIPSLEEYLESMRKTKRYLTLIAVIISIFVIFTTLSNLFDLRNIAKDNDQILYDLSVKFDLFDWENAQSYYAVLALDNGNVKMACDILKRIPIDYIDFSGSLLRKVYELRDAELEKCVFEHPIHALDRDPYTDLRHEFQKADLAFIEYIFQHGVSPDRKIDVSVEEDETVSGMDALMIPIRRRTVHSHYRRGRSISMRRGFGSSSELVYKYDYKIVPIPGYFSVKRIKEFVASEAFNKRFKPMDTVRYRSMPQVKTRTLLMFAKETSNLEYLHLLIKYGVTFDDDFNKFYKQIDRIDDEDFIKKIQLSKKDWSPLEIIIINDDIVELESYGLEKARLYFEDKRDSIMSFSVSQGSHYIVKELIEKHEIEFTERPAELLIMAYKAPTPWVLDYLLSLGLHNNVSISRELFMEALGRTETVVDLFFQDKTGIRPKIQDSYVLIDALHYHSKVNHRLRFDYVVESHRSGWKPIHHAAAGNNQDKLVELLDSNLKLLDERDSKGQTPLLVAVEYGARESIDTLLKYPQNLNAENNGKENAVILASHFGDVDVLEKLISLNASLTNSGNPACAISLDIIKAKNMRLSSVVNILGTFERKGHSARGANVHKLMEVEDVLVEKSRELGLGACRLLKTTL